MTVFPSFRLLWFPLILAVAVTIFANVMIISRLLISKSRHMQSTSSASHGRITHIITGSEQTDEKLARLHLQQHQQQQALITNQSTTISIEKYTDVQLSGRHAETQSITGLFTNETLPSNLRTGLLKPGTTQEAVARKLMSIRRHQIVNSHDYEYRMNPVDVCINKTVEVVLCVVTAVKNVRIRSQFRDAIKGGYAAIWNEANKAVLLFFLGLASGEKSDNLQAKVNSESLKFGDIVQATFIDTYRNLSIKTVSILKWVSVYCAHAKFVIKTDDDCDVNIPLMITELHKMQHEFPLFILGKVSRKLTPVRIKHSKWYIPLSVYKEEKFPTFMYGGSQGYPTEVARLLYEASLRIPTFWLEDVYISGLCADMVNIPRLDNEAFYFSHFPPPGETEY